MTHFHDVFVDIKAKGWRMTHRNPSRFIVVPPETLLERIRLLRFSVINAASSRRCSAELKRAKRA